MLLVAVLMAGLSDCCECSVYLTGAQLIWCSSGSEIISFFKSGKPLCFHLKFFLMNVLFLECVCVCMHVHVEVLQCVHWTGSPAPVLKTTPEAAQTGLMWQDANGV